jgi:pyruvate dehydrogenase E1 component
MGAGSILREVEFAAEILRNDYKIESDVWSMTSVNEVAREGQAVARWNLLHADKPKREAYITQLLKDRSGPVIASTDYMKTYVEQLRAFVPKPFTVLGTDGFGRSDTRSKLRYFFEVDRYFVTVAALKALADEGKVDVKVVVDAMKKFGIDPEKPNPLTV